MALVTSSMLKGAACPVCGKADRACGTSHPEVNIVDLPEGTMAQPATHLATAVINGQTVTIRTDLATAKARGWTIIGPWGAAAFHKARGVEPAAPAGVTGTIGLEAMSRAELYTIAQELDIAGRSTMDRDQLAAAIAEAGWEA